MQISTNFSAQVKSFSENYYFIVTCYQDCFVTMESVNKKWLLLASL